MREEIKASKNLSIHRRNLNLKVKQKAGLRKEK
jgi:hypothetical protein